MTTKNKKIDESREPREAQTREKKVARKPWAKPSEWDEQNHPEEHVNGWVG